MAFPPRTASRAVEDKVILICALITWQEQLMLCVFQQRAAPHDSCFATFLQIPTKYAAGTDGTEHQALPKKQINKSLMHFDYSTW